MDGLYRDYPHVETELPHKPRINVSQMRTKPKIMVIVTNPITCMCGQCEHMTCLSMQSTWLREVG